jgi:hypothetical protein
LAQRYGVRRDSRRRAVIGISVAVATVFFAWLAWATYAHVSAEVTSSLEGFDIVDDASVTAVVLVDVTVPGVDATCRVRAFAEDHSVVGEVAFAPDPGAGRRQVVAIRTERRATAVESLGCTTPNQKRPR